MPLLSYSWSWQASRPRQPHQLPSFSSRRITAVAPTFRCSSKKPNNTSSASTTTTPLLLQLAVTTVTELLRFLSPSNKSPDSRFDFIGGGGDGEGEGGRGLDGVVGLLRVDYENAYFLTGEAEILLQKFMRRIVCLKIQPSNSEGVPVSNNAEFILATWKFRTYLNLPWKPLILIEGCTKYYLNDNYQIIRHAERWNVSAIEAVGQIFKPS